MKETKRNYRQKNHKKRNKQIQKWITKKQTIYKAKNSKTSYRNKSSTWDAKKK